MGQFPSEDFCCQVMNAENNKTAHYLSCTAFWYALQTSKLISRATPTRICHRSICLPLPSNIILCLFTTAQHICSSSSFCGHLQNYTTSFVCRQPVCSSLIKLNSKSNISCHLSSRLRPSHECFLNTMSFFLPQLRILFHFCQISITLICKYTTSDLEWVICARMQIHELKSWEFYSLLDLPFCRKDCKCV